jgi:putative nucleotidyltransferase with HDIG domain
LKIERARVIRAFDQYAGRYDLSDVKVKLKYEHTFRVAQNADRIAGSLFSSEADRDLAWLLGMLHDIGRFEQLRQYGTFQDKNSVNHAALSADILFRENLITRFTDDRSEDRLIEKAVRLHNAYHLPKLSEREYIFCTILRDADKADILRVNCETPRTEIYDLPEEEFENSFITDEIYQSLLSGSSVDRTYSKTGIDFILGHIAFVYGLVWPESLKIVEEQGYLLQLLSFQSSNPDTRAKMKIIRKKILDYLKENQSKAPQKTSPSLTE